MFIPFDQLPAQARIWVYQADRIISSDERDIIAAKMTSFCQQWNSHDKPLHASFQLLHDIFAVIGLDEDANSPGGCAIDDSMRILKTLQKELGIRFLERTKIACWVGDKVEIYSIQQAQESIEAGRMTPSTLMFNNLITKKEDLQKNWRIPIQSSWVAPFLLNCKPNEAGNYVR